jgi:hypothetical protein
MEQAHCATSENLQLGRLVADAVVEIEWLGYSRRITESVSSNLETPQTA